MCTAVIKYFEGVGWIGAKNRDRNYKPTINIVQSNRRSVQRLYIDDSVTRWTEGLNEFGVCILNTALSVKDDEKDSMVLGGIGSTGIKKRKPSKDGKRIRDALYLKTPKTAIDFLVEQKLTGATFVFNENECYVLEGGYKEKKSDNSERVYHYRVKKIDKDTTVIRTNHGVYLPFMGYSKDSTNPKEVRSRESSDSRLKIAKREALKITDPKHLMDAISATPDSDPFMNPLRRGRLNNKDMITTGQLMLNAKSRTMHYRPIYSAMHFDYEKINRQSSKTYFEIISNRNLLTFKESFFPT